MVFDPNKVDLGSLSQVSADEELDSDFNIGDDNLEFTMNEAVKINPDQHAKVLDLSKKSGIPSFAVADAPEEIEQTLKVNQFDFSSLRENSPVTAKHFNNIDNAIVGQDDIDVLSAIEDIFDFGKTFENIGESISTGFSAQGKGLLLAGTDMAPDRVQDLIPMGSLPMFISPGEAQLMSEDMASRIGVETDAQLQQVKEESTDKLLTDLRELHEKRAQLTPEDLNLLEQGVRAGIESLANMAPGFAAMLASGGRAAPLLATIGTQTFGASFGEGRAEGLTPQEAGWFAGIDAAIEVGTEILPTGTLETILTGKSTGLKKEALKFMVREMGTEQLATLGQTINSYAFGLDEQMEQAETVGEMVDIQLQRQAVTAIATVVAGGAQITAATGIRKSIEALTQSETAKQTKGQVEQGKIDELNANAEKSKLRERDKESFKNFVKEADGENNTHVFIDGTQASLYLQEKTPEEIEADPALKLLSEQAQEAAALGIDVQVPVADFATDIAGTEHYEQLRDSMTMSEETISPFRQEQTKQETENYIKTLMDEAQESSSEYVEAQEIYTTVRDQLVDTGQVTPANASVMAQVVPAWATAQARRQGKTVTQVYQDAGLVVEGPQTGERARLEGEQVLEQPAYEDAPIVFERVRDDFLELLPEDATVEEVMDAVDGFSPEQRNFIKALDRDDWLGFDHPSQAISQVLSEEGFEQYEVSTGLKQSIGRMVNKAFGIDTVPQRDTLLAQEEITDEQRREEPAGPVERRPEEATRTVSGQPPATGWVENTRVVEDGKPARLYRGETTGAGLAPENYEQLGVSSGHPASGMGVFFSTHEEKAAVYGDNVEVFYLDLRNPKVYLVEELPGLTADGHFESIETAQAFAQSLKDQGHDGIAIDMRDENWEGEIQYVSFEAQQVVVPAVEGEVFKQKTDGEPVARGYYDPANSVIRLTESADLSTFLHEFAHFMYEMEVNGDTEMLQSINSWYKRNADDVAKEANDGVPRVIELLQGLIKESKDPRAIKHFKNSLKNVESFLKSGETINDNDVITYIDNNTTGNEVKDKVIRHAVHEQFARGFETYLMEGKAPSIELRNAFRAFARWLSRIYQALRGGLDVNLDAEMRQVFDRLLATEEQIAAAEARARVEPMFTDAAMAGMTEAEFADYQTRQEKVKDVQSETLRDKIIKQLTRQTKAWWKEEKQDIIDDEIDTLRKEQVYRARAELKTEVSTQDFDDQISELNKNIDELETQFEKVTKNNDTIGQYISRQGGLNREEFASQGVDKDHFKDKQKVFGKPLFPKKGGMTPDDLAENLNELNFQGGGLSANDALEIVLDMLMDDTTFIDPDVTAEVESIDRELDALQIEKTDVERKSEQLNIKLDHAAVKAMVGEEKTDKLGRISTIIPPELRGMTAKGMQGIHPDEAAAFFGYSSGSEMLIDLITAPTIRAQAEVNAEAAMVDRHGDILTDGTIEREADEAVQNEERGKLILHELKMLARGTNAPTIERNAVKALAEERIGRLSFREIHPGKYRKAEIRAAQESARMLAEGNKEGAADAKMRQVMNYYLGMAATNAKNETTKIVDRMSRYNKKKVREEIQKAQNGYWEQITKILDRFEFKKSATLIEVENINTWAKDRMENDGDGLVLSNAVLNESYVTHWKNVPFADLQGVNDSVKNIEHVARYANKMVGMQEEIDYNKLKSNWITHIEEQDAKFATKESRSRIDDARKATTSEHVQRWLSQLTKIPFMASWLDGGDRVGLSHDILVQQFTDALDAKMTMVDEVATPVLKSIANRSKEDIKRHNRKIFIPEINDTLMGHQILAVALNTGNQGNLKKLLLGEGWANPDIEAEITFDNTKLQAVLANMTKSDWELVQSIWNQMDSLYPQLAETHRRTTGLVPPKVEATPVVTEHGTFKGGYYPVKYSPKRSHKAEKNAEKREAETESMFNNTASIQASVNAGATNERTGFYDRIHLSLEVVPDHFNETIHYITHHDAVRQVNRLIQSPDVANAITGVLGEAEFKELKPWLNDIAKDGRQQPVKTFIDEAFHRLRFGTTLGVMGFKASTGIMQLFGIFTTGAELGVGPTLKGVQTVVGRSFYMKAARKLLGNVDDLQTGWEFASERSKVLPHRVKTMDREIRNAMNRLSKKTGALAAVQEASMKHIALIQTYMVDLPTWHAAYEKHLSENGDEVKAVQFADATIENVQGSGATKDMARIMRSQSKIHSTFTMFMTFFSSLGNLTRDLARGAKSGQYSLTSVAAKTMFLFTLPVFFEMLMRGELDEPEGDDERMSKFLTASALYPLTSVPFVRDVASGALTDFGYNSTPVAAMLERGITSGKGLVENLLTDEEITKSQVKNVSKLAGAAIGIPGMNQMWSTGEHLYDVIEEGEDLTGRELIFGPDRD